MRKTLKRVIACGLSVTFFASGLTVSPIVHADTSSTASAVSATGNTVQLGKGSYSTVTKGKQVYSEQAGLVDRTTEQAWWPKRSVPGNVYVTDNMKGAIPTNDWATSFLWGSMYGGVSNPFSEPAYAFPLAYQASSEGMYLTQPPVHIVTQSSGAMDYGMPLQPGYIDLAIKPAGFTPVDAKVDKVTDWSYDIVMENGDQKMKTTMTQGSPYAFFECENTDVEINFKRGTRMYLVEQDDNVLVLKVLDNKENDYNYYAFYGPEGVKWDFSGNATDSISRVGVEFPDNKEYMSIAILPDESTDYVDVYKDYAYNFITNTEVEWLYREDVAKVYTNYYVDTERKEESQRSGTIMGLLPHQYKNSNLASYAYMEPTYDTVRGKMKLYKSRGVYKTELNFTGILPFMPDVAREDRTQLASYLDEFMNRDGAKNNPYMYIYEGEGDTYWTGKALNNVVNALAVAEQIGDKKNASALLSSLKAELEDWFSTTDEEQDRYFYYDKEVGTLVGYPSNFGSDTQLNDHHFHYGYYIYAAAQVALRDPQWAKDSNWGGMVRELIYDIACPERSGERYPFLRNFAPYEGHSWASGHQLFTDGNNQESSSEALNAWAGIILFGMATGDTKLRDLGIYLYTTEISAVENYWFDLDKDVLSPQYRYRDASATEYDPNREEIQTQASMIWGGKYVYGTWWTAEPLQVQGINLLPMTGASLYLAKDKDYIKANYASARKMEESYTGPDKLANPTDRWNDIWNEYLALADPEQAFANWSTTAAEEGGESRAHTFHYIKSLEQYGTPDFSVTSPYILAMAFNKNGKMSYSAYNTTDTLLKVVFSDGGCITVGPHSMHTGADGTTNYDPSWCSGAPVVTPPPTTVSSPTPLPSFTTLPVTWWPSLSPTPNFTTLPVTYRPSLSPTPIYSKPPISYSPLPSLTISSQIPMATDASVKIRSDILEMAKAASTVRVRFDEDNMWSTAIYRINGEDTDHYVSLHRENGIWVGEFNAEIGDEVSLYVAFNKFMYNIKEGVYGTNAYHFKVLGTGLYLRQEEITNFPPVVSWPPTPTPTGSSTPKPSGTPVPSDTAVPQLTKKTISIGTPVTGCPSEGRYFEDMTLAPESTIELGSVGRFYKVGEQDGIAVLNKNVLWASACITVDGGAHFKMASMLPRNGAWYVPVDEMGDEKVGISFVYPDDAGTLHYYGPFFFEEKENKLVSTEGDRFEPITYYDRQNGTKLGGTVGVLENQVPIKPFIDGVTVKVSGTVTTTPPYSPVPSTQPPVISTQPPVISPKPSASYPGPRPSKGAISQTYEPYGTLAPDGIYRDVLWLEKASSKVIVRFKQTSMWSVVVYRKNGEDKDHYAPLYRREGEWCVEIDAFVEDEVSLYIAYHSKYNFTQEVMYGSEPFHFKVTDNGLEAIEKEIPDWQTVVTLPPTPTPTPKPSKAPSIDTPIESPIILSPTPHPSLPWGTQAPIVTSTPMGTTIPTYAPSTPWPTSYAPAMRYQPISIGTPASGYPAEGSYFDGMMLIPEDTIRLGEVGRIYNFGNGDGIAVLNKNVTWASACITVDGGAHFKIVSMMPSKGAWYVPFDNVGDKQVGISFLYLDEAGRYMYYGPFFFEEKCNELVKAEGDRYEPYTYKSYPNGIALSKTYGVPIEKQVPIDPYKSWLHVKVTASPSPSPVTTTEVPVSPTPTCPPTTNPPTTCPPTIQPTSPVKVDCQYTSRVGSCIEQTYEIASIGAEDIDLSKLRFEYHYETTSKGTQCFSCTHAGLQTETAPYYQDLTSVVAGTFKDGYLEFKVNSNQILRKGNNRLRINVMMHQQNWMAYEQFKEKEIIIYYDGKRIN